MTYATLSKAAATVRLRIIFCTVEIKKKTKDYSLRKHPRWKKKTAYLYSLREKGQIIVRMITDVTDRLVSLVTTQ